MKLLTRTLAAALIAGGVSSSADAVPLGASLSLRDASTSAMQTVQWRRGWGWGGLGVGLAAGVIIGGAIAASTYSYGYAPTSPAYGTYPSAYSYGYAPAYYGYSYAPRYYAYGYPRYRAGPYGGYRPWHRW